MEQGFDLDRERQFFDAFEADHGDYDVLAEASYRRILSVFEREMQLRAGRSCIDLGCGTGAFTRRLTAFGVNSTGMDVSSKSIERANALGGGRFLVGDICNATLPSESYDCAVMSGVLHHLPTRTHRIDSLREAHRLLKRDGRFYSYDPNAHSPSMWLYRDPRSPFCSSEGKTENEVLLSRTEIADELRAAGFVDIVVRGLSGIAYRYVRGRIARQLLPIYNRIYEPAIRFSGFERRIGTFLVASAVKR